MHAPAGTHAVTSRLTQSSGQNYPEDIVHSELDVDAAVHQGLKSEDVDAAHSFKSEELPDGYGTLKEREAISVRSGEVWSDPAMLKRFIVELEANTRELLSLRRDIGKRLDALESRLDFGSWKAEK
jgi:hypothetical protein